jgi:hypothetical protein
MSRVIQVVFARSGCAVILSSVGGLIGLVSWAARTAQSEYPRSPSCIVWAAVGGTFGFVLGACMGNRRLTGRRAWLVSGLVAGMLAGALVGWIWAHAEYGFAQAQLLQAGLPAKFINAVEGGLSIQGYETVGLQYGICLGILAGSTTGWFWNIPQRLGSVANLFPVLTSCFVALNVIAMRTGFRDLSQDVIERVSRTWIECQPQKLPKVWLSMTSANYSRPRRGLGVKRPVLAAVADDTNPKRQREHPLITSLALRVSMECVFIGRGPSINTRLTGFPHPRKTVSLHSAVHAFALFGRSVLHWLTAGHVVVDPFAL